jgi:hypothetical protein
MITVIERNLLSLHLLVCAHSSMSNTASRRTQNSIKLGNLPQKRSV